MSKAQSKAYAKEQRQRMLAEIEQSKIRADLSVLDEFRRWLIFKRRYPIWSDDLLSAVDDYVGELTGDRTTLHNKNHSIP